MKCIVAITLLLSFIPLPGRCEAPITIYYVERIPYMYQAGDGHYGGLVLAPVELAFKKANIPYVIEKLPAKRHLIYLKENRPNICAVGWYKNPEREKFAKYSKAIYQNKSRIAIARNDNDAIVSGKTLEAVFENPDLTLLVKDGYSYGAYIDDKIAKYRPNTHKTTEENLHMIKLIHAGRYDYFFLSEEEADALIPRTGLYRSDFKYIHFEDIPVGLKRYILFSKQVDDKIVERINNAIDQIVKIDP